MTVTVEYNYEMYAERLLEKGYYLPETETKTFTVSGLNSYLTKDKITNEVINEAIAKANNYLGDGWDLGKVYFLKVKESEQGYRANNYIVVSFSKDDSYWTTNRATIPFSPKISH
jgi:hypothetical protein